MKIKYDINSFIDNFKKIVKDAFGVDAAEAKYSIKPIYDPKKSETGEDSVFRLVILSENNVGGRIINFEDTISILTAFESHYPTKIEITKVSDEASDHFEIKCSTRIRKPSAIANIEKTYAPFAISDKNDV